MNKSDRIRIIIGNERKAELVLSVFREFTPRGLEEVEFKHIQKTLIHFDGSKSTSAESLGISYGTLTNKMRLMKIRGYDLPESKHRIVYPTFDENRTSGAV
jgi:DNA-binding NtrC family response regulator